MKLKVAKTGNLFVITVARNRRKATVKIRQKPLLRFLSMNLTYLRGPEVDTEPWIRWGYFNLAHAAKLPG